MEISIGKRKVPAVVTSSSSIEEQKISLKKSGFQLKKISSVINENPQLTGIQFKIALWLSRNYFAPLGMCFKTVLPNFFNNPKFLFVYPEVKEEKNPSAKNILTLCDSKKVIDEIMAEIKKFNGPKKQVLIITPEISIAKYFYGVIAGYYETALLHSGLTIKQNYKEWKRISSGDAEVIIGTRQALFAPFSDLGLVIVEDPANEAYKSDMSPKYNARHLAAKIAEFYSAGLMLISQIPDISGYVSSENGSYELKEKRSKDRTGIKAENMLQEIKSGNFSIFSRELRNDIGKYIKDNKKILLFSSRKGYSGYLVCENCGFSSKCDNCSLPMRIYRSPEDSLMCHKCSAIRKIPDHCPNCRSYKLKAAGFAGSEKIKEEFDRLFGEYKKDIFVFDSGSIKNQKNESELVKKMEESGSFVCIATQSIFSHRFNLKFDLIGIPNFDGLTVIPDFKAEEELFLQFEKLLDLEPEKVVIQTFSPDGYLVNFLIAGKYKEFYDKELQLRKLLFYPPFSRLIKLSISFPDKSKAGYEARILSEKIKMAIIQKRLTDSIKVIGPSPSFIEKEKGLYKYNLVLKIAPNLNAEEILRYVPSTWMIDVDPRSIL